MKKLLAVLALVASAVFVAHAETIDLSKLQNNTTVHNGDVLIGRLSQRTPKYIPKVTIEAGATVTVSNVVIYGHTYTAGVVDVSAEGFNNDWAGLTCAGNATIVLYPGTTNEINGCQSAPAIYIPEGYTLTIKGDGSLDATSGGLSAAIGGGYGRPCGNINIKSGLITAQGRARDTFSGGGAAIGGGMQSTCGDITISGGEVWVDAVKGAALGSGVSGTCGNITISGGMVTGHGARDGQPGIGSGEYGECGWIEITGGRVSVSGGAGAAGIGAGREAVCGDINFRGGEISVFGGAGGAGVGSGVEGTCGTTYIWPDISRLSITRSDTSASFIGPGRDGSSPTPAWVLGAGLVRKQPGERLLVFTWDGDLAKRTKDAIAYEGMTLYGKLAGNCKVSIASQATVTLNDVTISGVNDTAYPWAGINLMGDGTLVLAEGTINTVKGFEEDWPGVYVPADSKLTIRGGGTLKASSNGWGAGIGGGYSINSGAIDIKGGVVEATGGQNAAGIGGGGGADSGDIKITAGITRVKSTGGSSAQPIGKGYLGESVQVTVDAGLTDTTSGNTRTIMPKWDGDLSKLNANADVTAYDGMTIFGKMANKAKVSIADGATVTLKGVEILFDDAIENTNYRWAGLTCKGDATIILENTSRIIGFYQYYPAVYVPQNKTLTIRGGGALYAYCHRYSSGIGGGWTIDCGNIDIESGSVYAWGGQYCAAIGGGYSSACGSVHVAASVTKVEAKLEAASNAKPIGKGQNGSGGTVTVDNGAKDVTSSDGLTRTITWNGDLGNLSGDMTAINGTVMYGTLAGNYKVSIADGATVTLSNAVIRGVNDANCPWAGLTCIGNATINLVGDNEINCFYQHRPGIYVPSESLLTINGGGSATLFASSIYGAGIGGGSGQHCGNITINGGIVTAVGGGMCSGIGTGGGATCGTITVNAGVTRVMATAGDDTTKPMGAGYGSSSGTIIVKGVGTKLTDTTSGKTRTICWDGNLTQTTGDRTAFHGMTLSGYIASGTLRKISIEPGATVTLSGVTIDGTHSTDAKWAGLNCIGDATLKLDRHNAVYGFYYDYPGIYVPAGSTLTISGTTGSLDAHSNGYGAGIGGGFQIACGDIVIESGTIDATGGDRAAGIGGGAYAASGTITIGQGITRVTATCGTNTGLKPIGPGTAGSGGDVVLDGLFDDVTSGNTRTITPAQVWDGNLSTLTRDATAVNGTVIRGTLAGQYKVSIADGATVTLSNATITCGNNNVNCSWAGLNCLGDATIVLKETNTVKGFYENYPGIHVPEDKILVINGTGSLDASSNGWGAGIGGGYNIACGHIYIFSGTITATGGKRSAGIGGSHESACGNIYIGSTSSGAYSGATVTATGGENGAGIGGGSDGSCGEIMIVGSTTKVDALGGKGGAGVGGGAAGTCGSIHIYGGTIVAKGSGIAAGIGSGEYGECGDIDIEAIAAGTISVTATCGNKDSAEPIGAGGNNATCGSVYVASSLYDDGGSPTRTIEVARPWDGNLATLTGDVTALQGTVIYGTLAGNYKISIADGATVVLSNAVINGVNDSACTWAGITCLGDAQIALVGANTVKGFGQYYPGIFVPEERTLRIMDGCDYSEAYAPGGSLTVRGGNGNAGYAAGIGAGFSSDADRSCGNIVIRSGKVTAYGGQSAAGIGGAYGAKCGTITIYTGDIDASSINYGPGIGGGRNGSCGEIYIEGGKIVAKGGYGSAGIGGPGATCREIVVYTGIESVTAISGSNDRPPIEIDKISVDDSLFDTTSADGLTRTITPVLPWDGNLATLTRDETIESDMTLYGTLAGNYKISIADGVTVTLDGAVIEGENDSAYSWAGLTCLGDAQIVLAPESVNQVKGFGGHYPGIYVPEGSTLTIDGTGSLEASSNGYGAGIGGGYEIAGGNVVIDGGFITATGGMYSAGVGGGAYSSCGSITINGGKVTAVGGSGDYGSGAGIGGGVDCVCGDITIGSGIVRVVATRSDADAELIGKGAGDESTCGMVAIDPGLTKTTSADGNTLTITSGGAADGYEAWAAANGVTGEWDATDAYGIANVFRYAFGKPSGQFENPEFLAITFNAEGKAVIKTPPLVNTDGFTFTIEASDAADGIGGNVSHPLNASGETVINETGRKKRFFRIGAEKQ